MKDSIEQYLKGILSDTSIIGISFCFKHNAKTLFECSFGTPTSDTSELIDVVFSNKADHQFSRQKYSYKFVYFGIKESADCVLSIVVAESDTISNFQIFQITEYLKLVIKDYYITIQKDNLQKDLYRLWDILDASMKHYVNNELFSILGRLDVIKTSGNLDAIENVKSGLKDLITNVDTIFIQKNSVISNKGIIKFKQYYKDNNIIDID